MKHMLGNGLDSLQTQSVRLVVFRHVFKAVAIDAPVIQSIIDIVHHWNFMRIVAIILRQQAITNGLHQSHLFSRKVANGGTCSTRARTTLRVASSQNSCWLNVEKPAYYPG